MSLRRTFAVARNELRHIARDARTLFLVSVSPAFILFLLAYVFSFDVNHAKLALMDLDKSQAAQDYVAGLTSGDTLALTALADDYGAIDRLFVEGAVDAALIIPPNFGRDLQTGQPVYVQLLVDGGNPIKANQAISMVSAASASVAATIEPLPRQVASPVDVRSRVWYNATAKSLNSMVPGLLGVVMLMPALALSLALTREKELSTLEGLLATPLTGIEYLLGKMGAYALTGISSILLAWLMAIAWFRVPFRGDLVLLIWLTLDYFLASMGFSLVISTWISSQQTAMFIVLMIFFVPSFFLTGLIDPINRESLGATLTAWALPGTHYMVIARGIFLKGVGLERLLTPSLFLLGMGLTALAMSLAFFRKKLA
jgi:ABC-type Na+ efflux pump permease subunit